MRVHRSLGPGFLESVYQNALIHELNLAGLPATRGGRVTVYYKGIAVGDFICDVMVGHQLLVENKAVRSLVAAHEVQLVNYLTATGIATGLLFNFGTSSLQVKRKFRDYQSGNFRAGKSC